jgi:hypothetical protein
MRRSRVHSRASFLLAGTSLLAALTLLIALPACQQNHGTDPSPSQPIVPSVSGSNGCSAPDVVFTPGSTPVQLPLSTLVTTTDSQICAARGSEILFATGSNGQIVAIDVSGSSPAELELVASGTVATLLSSAGIAVAPKLSGIAVLDNTTLLVIERTSNTILAVSRTMTNTIAFFAGKPSLVPGFASGVAQGQQGVARFSFIQPSMLCPSGDGRVFVADPGNHAIRAVRNGLVFTAAGQGTPGFSDGDLDSALFDTPTGVTIACNHTLVVTEDGENGFGNRLRTMQIGSQSSSIGTPQGAVFTLLGNGTPATIGGPIESAQADGPAAPFVTTGDEVYWMDAASGVLRRARPDGTTDCPLSTSCALAVAFPVFAPGHMFSMAVTSSGQLFVLDATVGALARVAP